MLAGEIKWGQGHVKRVFVSVNFYLSSMFSITSDSPLHRTLKASLLTFLQRSGLMFTPNNISVCRNKENHLSCFDASSDRCSCNIPVFQRNKSKSCSFFNWLTKSVACAIKTDSLLSSGSGSETFSLFYPNYLCHAVY